MSTLEDELEKQEREDREARAGDSAGPLASSKGAPLAALTKGRHAFDEGDQEALYMLAHDHQRVGRRGLGKSETLKISGEH